MVVCLQRRHPLKSKPIGRRQPLAGIGPRVNHRGPFSFYFSLGLAPHVHPSAGFERWTAAFLRNVLHSVRLADDLVAALTISGKLAR